MRHGVAWLSLLGLVAGCGEPTRTRFTQDTGVVRLDAGADGGDGAGRCEPERIYCEGSSVAFTCDDRGQVLSRTICEAPNPTCAPGLGCRVCRPGSTRCNPDAANTPQRCRDDGTGWDDGAACNAEDGSSCVAGVCTDRCADSALGRSYLGCSYWPTVTANSGLDPMFRYAVVLANPQTYPVRATITGGALDEPRTLTLEPGAIETVELPWVIPLVQLNPMCPRIGDRCLSNPPARSAIARGGAYHVQTNGPIAAYQFNPLTYSVADRYFSYTNDASLLLPQGVLRRNYTVSTWPDWTSGSSGTSFGGFVAIVATTGESTTVTVRVAGPVRAGNGVEALRAGQRATYTLQEGDVVELVGDRGDLTGTTIESSQPVAVFVGHDCTNVPANNPACDHLEEQLLPDETWGQDYVVSALRDRGPNVDNYVRILSRVDDNMITFEPEEAHAPATLSRGEVLEFRSRRHFRVRGSGAFLVTQFMAGQGPATIGGGGAGDPAMVTEVPVQQYRDRYDFYVPSTYPQNFINVVAPQGAALTLDDVPLRGSMEALGNLNVFTLPIQSGAHRLRAPTGQGVGVKVYGVAPYTSYMYPGGLDLQLITPPG